MTIEAVLFDADGVLVFSSRFAHYLRHEYNVTPSMTRSFFQEAFTACLIGQAKLREVLPPFLEAWGWEGTVDQFITTWLTMDDAVDQRVAAVIDRLRGRNIPCYLATNQECNRARYMRSIMGFPEMFDGLFFSCELGCRKPDPAYYQSIQRALGLQGAQLLFWDDDVENVKAARACGWSAELYTQFESFERSLEKYLP